MEIEKKFLLSLREDIFSRIFLQYDITHVYNFLFQTQGRESIAAKLVANLITEAGANRVLACDLHSGQSMGYFDIPVDHVYGQVRLLAPFE